jgi:predicted ribosome-associated RNA-binding protein Tma20
VLAVKEKELKEIVKELKEIVKELKENHIDVVIEIKKCKNKLFIYILYILFIYYK